MDFWCSESIGAIKLSQKRNRYTEAIFHHGHHIKYHMIQTKSFTASKPLLNKDSIKSFKFKPAPGSSSKRKSQISRGFASNDTIQYGLSRNIKCVVHFRCYSLQVRYGSKNNRTRLPFIIPTRRTAWTAGTDLTNTYNCSKKVSPSVSVSINCDMVKALQVSFTSSPNQKSKISTN